MLNFAEQTGSGAVIFVWSFLFVSDISLYINSYNMTFSFHFTHHEAHHDGPQRTTMRWAA
eukprot:scaffold49502_cov53-Attheya_sp.AAC.1